MPIKAILDLFFPKLCARCSKQGSYLCLDCKAEVRVSKIQHCPKCLVRSNGGCFCGYRCAKNFHFNQLVVCSAYKKNDFVKKLITLFKYRFSMEAGDILAEILCHQFLSFRGFFRNTRFTVVPVPISKRRFKYRGFNQADILAQKLVGKFTELHYCDALFRRNNDSPQAELTRTARIANVSDSIGLKTKISGRNVLLIDDVATTLSTLNECSRILKKAGAKYICGFVLARRS